MRLGASALDSGTSRQPEKEVRSRLTLQPPSLCAENHGRSFTYCSSTMRQKPETDLPSHPAHSSSCSRSLGLTHTITECERLLALGTRPDAKRRRRSLNESRITYGTLQEILSSTSVCLSDKL